MALVSIIVPVYNAEEYLEQCLTSIKEQILKDIEVILIDDGSTDSSLAICEKYAKEDNRFVVIHQENGGACVARNVGIRKATGQYLLFLDSDDFFEPDMCSIAYKRAQQADADMVLFAADVFDCKKQTFQPSSWLLNMDYVPKKPFFNRHDVPDSLFLIAAGGPCNKLFRRELIISNGIDFPILPSLEDVPFVYSAMAMSNRIVAVDQVLQHYRRNAPKKGLVAKASEQPTRIFLSYGILKNRLTSFGVYNQLEQSFINRAASDFVDQYLYVLKEESTKEFFKHYLAQVAADDFQLRDKGIEYFKRPFVYNNLCKLLDDKEYNIDYQTIENNDPIVSVIVPVYNVELYLRECINSLIKQSIANFEMIFVDDGSTDCSFQILKEYEALDSRITVMSQKNQYAGIARNTGMAKARGTYLLFLDPDDFFSPTLLEELVGEAEKTKADIVLCDGYYYDNIKRTYSPARLLLQRYNIPSARPFSYRDNPDKILHISIDCPWNKLFKRAFIEAHSLQFQGLRSANDVYFVDSALLLADRISIVDKKLVNYRTNVHTSLQATRDKEPLNFYQALTAVRERMKVEDRYPSIERSLISLFIAGCRSHLNRAKDAEEFSTLLAFYKEEAFSAWELDASRPDQFVYISDQRWVSQIQETTAIDYLLNTWRETENQYKKLKNEIAKEGKKATDYIREKESPSLNAESVNPDSIIKYYRSYKIGCAITWLPRKARGFARCIKEHGLNYTARRAIEHLGIPADAEMPRRHKGVTRKKRRTRIIVSLTSYPGRIHCVHKAIESLLNQTTKPDMIILWLAGSQFPGKLKDLPRELLSLRRYGLTISWCDDLKSHKKYYQVMQQYPNDIVITVDDDLYYDEDMIELLFNAHQRHPGCVCAMRCHLIRFGANGKPLPYKQWLREQSEYVNTPLMQLFSTSGAGTLYPPACMSHELFNKEAIREICLDADDLWLKTMQIINRVKTVQVTSNRPLRYVEDSQHNALWHTNVTNNGNDEQLKQLAIRYPNTWCSEVLEDEEA